MASSRDRRKIGDFFAFVLAVAAASLGLASAAFAQADECLVEVQQESSGGLSDGATLCGDADASNTCTFSLGLCLNQSQTGCTTAEIKGKKAKLKTKGKGCKSKVSVATAGASSTCGAFAGVTVKTKKKGTIARSCTVKVKVKTKGKPARSDSDTATLTCNPPSSPCPTTTTTTTIVSGSTTTTTIGGPCDTCCPSATTKLRFTTSLPSIGGGGCGNVKDANNTTLFNIDCGGLYTGGAGGTLPLPTVVPDMGSSLTKVGSCTANGDFQLTATGTADVVGQTPAGLEHRQCTSEGVADPDYKACVGDPRNGLPCVTDTDCAPGTCTGTMPGCLFGPPLPIPNTNFAGASVCIVNRVATSATGSGNCNNGSTALNLPLASDLYLESDLLDGSAPDRPAVAGIQPCPLCTGAAGSETCKGGPKHGMPCTPGSSASLGTAHPTSHDCPPPPGALGSAYIGALPIPFGLTTDSTGTDPKAHRVATMMNNQEVFCGFCGAQFSPTFKNPPVPCTSNTQCAGVTGCPGTTACGTCKQRTSGAFGTASSSPGSEHEITLFGSSSGACISDGAPHATTLVSMFCIPPAYNATVDANGDLPGPGATALVGQAQLLP